MPTPTMTKGTMNDWPLRNKLAVMSFQDGKRWEQMQMSCPRWMGQSSSWHRQHHSSIEGVCWRTDHASGRWEPQAHFIRFDNVCTPWHPTEGVCHKNIMKWGCVSAWGSMPWQWPMACELSRSVNCKMNDNCSGCIVEHKRHTELCNAGQKC